MSQYQKNQIIDLRDKKPGEPLEVARDNDKIIDQSGIIDLRQVGAVSEQAEIAGEQVETVELDQPESGAEFELRSEPEPLPAPAPENISDEENQGDVSTWTDESTVVDAEPGADFASPEVKFWRPQPLTFIRQHFQINPSLVWRKPLALFILACVFSVTSIRVCAFFQGDLLDKKDRILADAHVAYQYMGSGGKSVVDKDYDLASYKFSVASQRFVAAQNELDILGEKTTEILSVLPGGAQVAAADNLLAAGSEIALASQDVTKALTPFTQTPNLTQSLVANEQADSPDKNNLSFTEALLIANNNLTKALARTEKAEKNLNAVSLKTLPTDTAEQVKEVKAMVPQINQALRQWLSYSEVMLEMLGHDNQRKYLFLFQNSRELRATGGFIGTYGLFDVDEGKVENIKIEGPYNIDGQLLDVITAPDPLRLITQRLYMRDANWFADYPTSAQKVSALYEKSGGATVDGVVSINSDFARQLMELTGPIEMPEYEATVSADNFYNQIQYEVEIDYDKEENRPKKILADLFPQLIGSFSNLDKEKWPQVLAMFFQALEKKDIMFYFQDEELEDLVLDFGWGGQLSQTEQDYLNVVTTNIGGGKTDHVMQQNHQLHVDIKNDGSVVNTLEITRSHQGNTEDEWEKVKNVSYLRMYVPLGSQLISAEGFDDWFFNAVMDPVAGSQPDPMLAEIAKSEEIDESSSTRIHKENGKTVFSNWLGIEPGESKTVKIKYKLPFKVKINEQDTITSYSLVLQQQPGSQNRQFTGQISYPEKWQPIWKYAVDGDISDNLEYQTEMDKDKVVGLIFAEEDK
ncbi:MAG: DUF4012 domain-containing protein [Parcubacteria group bacterium]